MFMHKICTSGQIQVSCFNKILQIAFKKEEKKKIQQVVAVSSFSGHFPVAKRGGRVAKASGRESRGSGFDSRRRQLLRVTGP